MKLSLFLILLSVFQSFAVDLLSQKITLKISDEQAPIMQILDEIETQTNVRFLYRSETIENKSVKLDVKNKTWFDILEQIKLASNIDYKILENDLVVLTPVVASQPGRNITGTVTDQSGAGIPGVSVAIKGTTVGTITGINGQFSITVPENAEIIVFSFVGMKSQEVEIGDRIAFNIIMTEEVIGMDEVVVVGYGTQKKINLTGSVDMFSGDKLQNRSASKVADLIKGVSPNLNISMSRHGGEPGAESSWNIRGMGSIHGGDSPLILVDGVEMSIGNIDPESIESISVLKDASASAIYGSRAPFGVILITTKMGKKGEMSIQYNNNVSLSTPLKYPSYESSIVWATAFNQGNANAGLQTLFPEEHLQRITGYLDGTFPYEYDPDKPVNSIWAGRRMGNANNDWPQILMKDFSMSQKHNINVSGGDDRTQYYVSGGYMGQEGLQNFTTDYYKRYNFLANFTSQVTDWFRFDSRVKYAKSLTDYPDGYTTVPREHLYGAFMLFAPMTPYYNINGTVQNPFVRLMQDSGRDKTETNDFFITLGGVLEPIKGWQTSLSFNHNVVGFGRTDNPKPVMVEVGTGSFGNIGKPVASHLVQFSNTAYTLYNVFTSYEKTLGEHYFKALAGYEQEEKNFSRLGATGANLITEEVPSLSTALGDKTVEDAVWHWTTQGVFGRFNYNFKETYLLEFSARYNGSSRFAPDNRWGIFPSASAGYNISNEDFWAPIEPYVNRFKIRASYGSLGNQNVSNYLYLSRIPVNTELDWIIEGSRPSYANAPTLISDDLTWETITTLNVGFDAGFLNNRLELGVDWFDRVTTNMLGPAETLPYLLGASTPQQNNAELSTKGFEVVLRWRDRISSDFTYNAQITIGDSRSTILKYKNDLGLINSWYAGKNVGEQWGYVSDGLIQEVGEEMHDQSYLHANWGPGDMKYKDLNDDGKIDAGTRTLDDHGDLTVIGNSTPRYNFGIIGGLTWKGIDFSMMLHGVGRRDYMPDQGSMTFWGMNASYLSSALLKDSWSLDYWRPADETNMFGPNTDSYFPRPIFTRETWKNRALQTRYLLNMAYVRLKNLQIGYTIPQGLSDKLFFQNARIYVSGENLLTLALSDLPKIIEPETTIASDPNYGGYSQAGSAYPMAKYFAIGLNITF